MKWQDILALTPEQIQAWLDQRLASASPEVRAVILKVDYVEPGSVRDPACKHYVRVGEYENSRDVVEVAFQVAPGGAELAARIILQLF